jgi:hypothetical protein
LPRKPNRAGSSPVGSAPDVVADTDFRGRFGTTFEEQSFSNPTPFWLLPAGAGTTLNVGSIPAGDIYEANSPCISKSQNEIRTERGGAMRVSPVPKTKTVPSGKETKPTGRLIIWL